MITADKRARVGKSAERRHPRFKINCEVQVRAGTTTVEARALDLSESGIAIQVSSALNPGDRVILQFTLPNSEHRFGIQATAKYSKEGRHGLEFHKLPRSESDELFRICQKLSADPEATRTGR